MEGIGKGIFIGISLIIIAAIVGISVSLFSTAKNTANDGNVQVQASLGTMNNSIYSDYDQKVVIGSQVNSAYNAFVGKPIGIIVKTCKGDWVNYNAVISPFTTTNLSQNTVPFKGISIDANKQYTFDSSYVSQTAANANVALVNTSGANPTVAYNSNVSSLAKSGDKNYVASTSTFYSYLIRDAADDIVGIVFIQQGKHVTT